MVKTIYDPRYQRVINQIKTQRLALGISQKEAGLRVQKSRQWIAKIETHELRLDILNFVQLCRAYKLKPSDLIKSLEEESSEDDSSLAIAMRWIIFGEHLANIRRTLLHQNRRILTFSAYSENLHNLHNSR